MVAQEKLNESLHALKRHVDVAIDIARLCRSESGKLGAGVKTDCIMKYLNLYRNELDAWTHQRWEEGPVDSLDAPARSSHPTLRRKQQQWLISSAKRFSGQLFVLPLAISLNNGLDTKYVSVILEYGPKLTSFEGSVFNGRFSRVLLDVHTIDLPKLSLTYKKRYLFKDRSKKLLGLARTVKVRYSSAHKCFEVTVIFGSYEQEVGQATFLVEWYPNICNHLFCC